MDGWILPECEQAGVTNPDACTEYLRAMLAAGGDGSGGATLEAPTPGAPRYEPGQILYDPYSAAEQDPTTVLTPAGPRPGGRYLPPQQRDGIGFGPAGAQTEPPITFAAAQPSPTPAPPPLSENQPTTTPAATTPAGQPVSLPTTNSTNLSGVPDITQAPGDPVSGVNDPTGIIEIINQYIMDNPDSWVSQAGLTGTALSALDPVQNPDVYARQLARGMGQDSTYAEMISPLVETAPGLLALMGQEGHDPVSLAKGIQPLVESQMTPGQYIDAQGLLDNMFTSGDLSAWGVGADASGSDQYEVIMGAANAVMPQLTEIGRTYLNNLLTDAYNQWMDLQLQGQTVDFMTFLRKQGAADWF